MLLVGVGEREREGRGERVAARGRSARCDRPTRWWPRPSAPARRRSCRAAPTPARTGSRRRRASRARARRRRRSRADGRGRARSRRRTCGVPMTADSAGSGRTSPVGIPRSSSFEVPARGKTQPPGAPRTVGQSEVRMPAERDRHAPAPGRDDRGVDAEHRLPDDRGDLDAMRERERGRVDVDRRAEPRGVAPRREPVDRPPGRADQEPVDRQPVVVDREVHSVEGDRHSRGAVAADRSGGSPTARAGADPPVRPDRRASRPPGSARCSPPRWRSDTPVIPIPGVKTAAELAGSSSTAGSPRNRRSRARSRSAHGYVVPVDLRRRPAG